MMSQSPLRSKKQSAEKGTGKKVRHGLSASISPEKLKSRDIKDYMELVETVARVEHSRLPNHLIDASEIVNIGALTLHLLFEKYPERDFNVTYLSTAIKWAVRNELRYRYKWYSLRNTDAEIADGNEDLNGFDDELAPERGAVREAMYANILSVDGLMEADNPHELRDESQTPDEKTESNELAKLVRLCLDGLPERDRKLIEARYFKNKRMREIGDEFGISASRASRVVQSALTRMKEEMESAHFLSEYRSTVY
jgi:RNA polymerase sigma factor (sigma-70 family)